MTVASGDVVTSGTMVQTEIYKLRWEWWHRREALGKAGDAKFLDFSIA